MPGTFAASIGSPFKRRRAYSSVGTTGSSKSKSRTSLAMQRFKLYRNPHSAKEFCETYETTTLGGGTTAVGGIWQVNMAALPNNGQVKDLFDLYCIRKFQVILLPSQPEADAANSATVGVASLVASVNRSPAAPTPTAITDVLGEDDARIMLMDGVKTITVTSPKPQLPAVGGVYYESAGPKWIDFGSGNSIQHYGVRYWWDPNGVGAGVKVFLKVWYSVKEQL